MNNGPYTPPAPQSGAGIPPRFSGVNPPPAPKPRLFDRKAEDVAAAIITVILSILGVSALLWDGLRLGYTLTYDALFILSTAYMLRKGSRPAPVPLILGLLSLICSWSFFITSNVSVRLVALAATAFGGVVWLASLSGSRSSGGDFGTLGLFFGSIIRALADLPRALASLFSKRDGKSSAAGKILVGVLCAVPLLFVVVPLLLSSDLAFSSLMDRLVGDVGTIFQKIVLGLIVSVFLIAGLFSLRYGAERSRVPASGKGLSALSVGAFLWALDAVYLIYLFSQLAYFFSAFSGILPDGYTFSYAEYARRGFFELCAVAAINLAVILAAIAASEKKSGGIPWGVRLPALFTVAVTFVMIGTSAAKMIMYINVYGMTVMRVCTCAFMLWMATVFVAALLRLFVRRLDVTVTAAVSGLLILAVLGVGNVNSFIARYNYDRYLSSAKVDVQYFADLRDEGVPYLCKLADDPDPDVSSQARRALREALPAYFDGAARHELVNIDLDTYKALKRTRIGLGTISRCGETAYAALDQYAADHDGFVTL